MPFNRAMMGSGEPFDAWMIHASGSGGYLEVSGFSHAISGSSGMLSYWTKLYINNLQTPVPSVQFSGDASSLIMTHADAGGGGAFRGYTLQADSNDGSDRWGEGVTTDLTQRVHNLFSWDVSTNSISYMRNGVDVPMLVATSTAPSMDWTEMTSARSHGDGIIGINVQMGELWLDIGQPYVSNLNDVIDKFYDAGKAVNLGLEGERPFGTTHDFYYSGRSNTDPTEYYTNRGAANATLVPVGEDNFTIGDKLT